MTWPLAGTANCDEMCDDQSNICWGLIGCMAENCAGAKDMEEANCAVAMCGKLIEGSGLAMAVGALLRGDACSADCPPPSR